MRTESQKTVLSAARRIDNERIDLLFGQSYFGIMATIFNSLVCAYLLRDLIYPRHLWTWVGSLLCVCLLRILLLINYRRDPQRATRAPRYKFWNIVTLGLSGVVWGTSAVFLFPATAIGHQLFLAIVTVGMVAGATMAFSIFQAAFLAFATPALLPISIRFLATPMELHRFVGILGIFLFLMSLLIARHIRKNHLAFLQLKETLAEQVAHQTETLRKTNLRLQAENQKRERIQAQLEETRKFEAIANLAGGVAHQFNNALSVIMGNSELLALDQKEAVRLKPYLDPINRSAQLMTQLTSQLLAYAKGGRYKPRSMELGAFVQAALATVRPTLAADLSVVTEFTDCAAAVEIDITQMQMVISAVIANAAEAADQKGRIQIACRRESVETPRNKLHGGLSPGDYMVLEVTDNGSGMNAEALKRVFEPFYTTKFQGRGLGMAAVYGIIKNHRGHINISSRTGRGTRVRIYLPVSEADMRTAIPSSHAKSTADKRRVLLIEDDAMVLEINQKLLTRLGYTVLQAPDGKTASDIIRAPGPEFDLVLLDLKLPDMDGTTLYPVIRHHRPSAKIIICSGYALEERTQALLDRGADGFIQKPFTLQAIFEKLNQVLAARSETPPGPEPLAYSEKTSNDLQIVSQQTTQTT